jgi:hypothetical protein
LPKHRERKGEGFMAQPENLDPKSPLLFTVLQKALEYRYPMMWGRDTGLQK